MPTVQDTNQDTNIFINFQLYSEIPIEVQILTSNKLSRLSQWLDISKRIILIIQR